MTSPLPFPIDPHDFDSDERISFSKLDNKYIAVYGDGTEYEFDEKEQHWIPMDELSVSSGAIVAAAPAVHRPDAEQSPESRKRKLLPQDHEQDAVLSSQKQPHRANKKQKSQPTPRQNTAVYVTGLPLDATVDEVEELFSRKAGLIAEEIDSRNPRIKMYTDSEGSFKGDALVVFYRPESVQMAIMLLDDTDFRITETGAASGRIRVQEADSSYKKTVYDQDKKKATTTQSKAAKNGHERQKVIKKTQKMESKLADWDDNDDPYQSSQPANLRWKRTVILRHMFTLRELESNPAALLEIKEDVRDECAKLGSVTNVVLFDQEPEGIVSVRFGEMEAAEACIRVMHGRCFDGRRVEAFLATGRERFRKSKAQGDESD